MHRITASIKSLFLSLFFLTPFLFTPVTSELFEFPKILFVYAITTIITTLHLINVLSGRSKLFQKTSLTFPLIAFLLSQIVATYFSIDQHTSIFGYYSRFNGGLLSTICYISLYFVLTNYIDDTFRYKIIKSSLLAGFLIALYGIAEHFGIDSHYWVQDVQSRVFSTLGQPNWLAAYLCILLPFSLYYYHLHLNQKKYFLLSLDFGLITIFWLCLLFTKSKTGIAAALASFFVFYFFFVLTNHFRNLKTTILVPLLLLIIALTINNPIKDIVFKTSSSSAPATNSTINITPSEDIRKLVWIGAIKLWEKFPYFGTGTETFAYSYYWTRPAAHNLTSEWDFLYNKAHNEYLNYLATTGTFGFGTYLIVIIVIVLTLLKRLRNHLHSHHEKIFYFTLLSSLSTLFITNATGFSVVITSLYFFLLPAFLAPSPMPITSNHKNRLLISIGLIGIMLYLLSKIVGMLSADINYNIADNYLNNAYYTDALSKINAAVATIPDEPIYLMKQADILTKNALLSEQQKNHSQALKYASMAIASSTKALKISPANINFYKEQSQMYYYLSTFDSHYFSKAIDSVIIATRLAPTDAKSFYILGKFWQTISDDDKAIAAYQKALELKANYDYAAFALGQLYYQKKDYSLAKKYFTQTLLIAPNNTDAQEYLQKIAKLKL